MSHTKHVVTEPKLPPVVSLFCGAGGLDLGFNNAGFDIALAIDISKAAISTHQRNFKPSTGISADLVELGPTGVLKYVGERIPKRRRIGIIGGPPCQGFSRANVLSSVDDPRNALPMLYLDIIRQLQTQYCVEFIVFENVLGIRDRKHAVTYKALLEGLEALGFRVTETELCAFDFGVPQMRRRVVLIAMRTKRVPIVMQSKRSRVRTVEDAIAGLPEPVFFQPGLKSELFAIHPNHWTMQPKSSRFKKTNASKSGTRSFRRLDWHKPSPTIAFGNREIHVHPNGKRRLSIYEAMLLQGFPKSFVLEGNLSQQVEQISNAVPPPLAKSVALAIRKVLRR